MVSSSPRLRGRPLADLQATSPPWTQPKPPGRAGSFDVCGRSSSASSCSRRSWRFAKCFRRCGQGRRWQVVRVSCFASPCSCCGGGGRETVASRSAEANSVSVSRLPSDAPVVRAARLVRSAGSENSNEIARRPLHDRGVDGGRGRRVHGAVPRVVDPGVATAAGPARSRGRGGGYRDRGPHRLARPRCQRRGLGRNRVLCRGRVVRLLQRIGGAPRRPSVGRGSPVAKGAAEPTHLPRLERALFRDLQLISAGRVVGQVRSKAGA